MSSIRTHTQKIALIALFTALIVVCSYITVPLTVPITLQLFAVCLAAAMLDIKGSLASVGAYILLGAFGLPVFSNFRGGLSALTGPTGGYIVGFLLTAAAVGIAVRLFGFKFFVLICSMAVGVLLCYAVGTVWFMVVMPSKGVTEVLSLCVLPFLLPDAIKILLAAFAAVRLKKIIK